MHNRSKGATEGSSESVACMSLLREKWTLHPHFADSVCGKPRGVEVLRKEFRRRIHIVKAPVVPFEIM